MTPFQIFGSCRDTTKALPYTKRIILRFLLVLMIISLNVSHFIVDFRAFIIYRKHQVMSVDDNQSYAELFAPLFQAGTFTLFGILLHTYQYRGIRTSGIAWSFTLLAVLLQCPELYMLTTLETDRDCFHVITFITQTICLLILHILTCFADKSKSKNKFYRNKVQQQKEESLLQSPSIQSNVSFEIEEDELEANLHQLECPSVRSSFLSLITFWWITPLMFAGYRETIFTDDLWLLRSNETCRHIIEQYIRSKNRWRRKICIWERLFQSFARSLLMGAIAQSIYIILLFTSPFILRYLLLSLSTNNEPDWHCYVLAILIFMVAMFQSATRTYIEHIMGHTRIAIRTALNGMIYRKLLRIHNCSRSRLTRTKMDKMLRSDVGRIADLMLNFQTLWSTPIIIGLTFYFLWNELERSILNGIILVAIIPLANLIISVVRHRLIQMRLQCKHERMETISQVLTRMLTIKLNGWEIPFIGKITNIREREICFISYISYLSSLVSAVWNLLPYSIAWLILSDYVTNNNFIDEIVIQPSKLFFILSLIEIVREPIVTFSELIGDLPEMIKIGRRLNRFFNLPDLEPYLNRYESSDDNAIEIHCGTFSWEQWIAMQSTIVLSCVDLAIKRGSLVAFVGNCETGKSSLISAMLGDMEQLDGEVMVARGETIAYVPQTPWIRIGTLRDNILFGLPYDKARYDEIIDLCYLKADFDSFPDGDITLINQHNRSLITIGQRQRISIARACYSMATIILFDDPVSTLSVPMAKQIFERVIGNDGYLRNRTRVIATNNIGVMRHADQIVVLANGTVYQTGSYQKLMDAKGKFVNLLNDYLRKKVENHSNENENESNDYCEQTTKDNGGGGGGDKLWRPPDPQSSGNVRPKIYYTYFDSLTSIFMVATICGFGFWQLFVIVSDVWLTLWSSGDLSPNSFGKRQPSNMTIDPVWQLNQQHLTIYGLFGMAQLIANVIGTFALSMGNVRSSIRLHRQLLERIMKAPMYYLDIGTIEKILDHFSTDVDVLDFQLAFTFARWIIAFVQLISILLFIIVKIPWTLLVIIPMVLTYWYIQKLYSSTCRQLFRLDSQIQCTIVNHFHETIDGTSTIRAFDRCAQFIRESNNHIDQYQRINRPLLISDLWLNLRLDWLGNVFLLIVTILAILMHDDLGNGFIGLIVLYSFTIGGILKRLVHHSRNWEQNMISVEHINELCYIPNEREWIRKRNENPNVSKQWPTKGIVEIRNFSTKYCDGLRMVVEGITANIDSSEKIAIVGTDGAGKSSLLMSMFRIIEAIDGKIQIDGVDISRIGLHELRQRLSIVTGNPTLFHETIRFNLDPFGQYEDNELWEALADCYLKDLIQKFDLGLNHMIISDNWLSIGQRQLFGLARALLRGTRVLFFEELDSKNDSVVETMIQRTIRNVFQHCTILTIVHQFATLLHCDRVMVLDSGKLIEFDEPATLLSNRRSHLYKLVKEDNIFR